MKLLFGILSGYFTLYLVIWLHEVGHAIFLTAYGCKKNPFHVRVQPCLYGSTPGETDYEKMKKIASWKVIVISYAGIGINILFGTLMLLLIRTMQPENYYVSLFLYLFMTLHYAEAITYLFFSNIILSSDMLQIASIQPKLRWVNLAIGIVSFAAYLCLMTQIPSGLKVYVYLWNIITIVCMTGGRIAFTLSNNSKK